MLQHPLRETVVQDALAESKAIVERTPATGLRNNDRSWPMTRLLRDLKAFIGWYLRYYKLMARDSRTPRTPKILLWSAVIYAVSPIGLVPDVIPILGYLDDVIIVPVLIIIAVRRVPLEVIIDCRLQMGLRRGAGLFNAPARWADR